MLSKITQYSLFLFLLSVTIITNAQQSRPSSAADRLKGLQQRQVLEKRSTVNGVKFRNIGPSVMSGRVADLEANPQDPTEFYVAYASGGLWHTINNGLSFTPIFDSADVITIGDLAVDW